jgi:hypothetical protein
MTDGRPKDGIHRPMYPPPLLAREEIARRGGVNAGAVEDFRGIEVAYSRHRPLVQQRHLDRPTALAQPFAKLPRRDFQGIWPQVIWAEHLDELGRREQLGNAQSALVPKQQLPRLAVGEVENQPEMRKIGRIAEEH